MVDRVPPAGSGTTVRDAADDPPPRGLRVGLAITVLAVGIAVAFALGKDDPADTAVHVVTAQSQPAEAGAPPTDARGGPRASAFGVSFPNLATRLGWEPVGRRDDVVDGRAVETVTYARSGRRLAYSVVDGPVLPAPPGGVRVAARGPAATEFEAGGRTAVLTSRDGHSSVVSAPGVPRVAVIRAARAR
jgi:hypothetical protein